MAALVPARQAPVVRPTSAAKALPGSPVPGLEGAADRGESATMLNGVASGLPYDFMNLLRMVSQKIKHSKPLATRKSLLTRLK